MPKSGDKNQYAAAVFDSILGGGMSSRLFQEIREKRGLLTLLILFSSVNFFVGSLYVIVPMIIVDQDLLGGNEDTFGIALSLFFS